jgi:carbamoyl-phosphate synthase large subunit
MDKKTILVTGIGGNVAQGIIRNVRACGYNVSVIGTNNTALSAGNHLVDFFYQVPNAYEPGYFPALETILKKHQIDLVIPTTDYEVYYLAEGHAKLNLTLASSGPLAAGIYLDKFSTWQFHSENNILFTPSILPSAYQHEFKRVIAKPRKGRGSRGIIKDAQHVNNLGDEEYLLQEMHQGTEITTAVYCSYKTRLLHGIITMQRSLESGATVSCRVVTEYDEQLRLMALQMIDKTDLAGSFNIQSIVDGHGKIHPFEINCRISGTNSIRSHFGFNDVKYTLQELLYNEEPEACNPTPGIAFRYLADVIYPQAKEAGTLKGSNLDDFIIF